MFPTWHQWRDGTIRWDELETSLSNLRVAMRATLETGAKCRCAKTAGTCWELLRVEAGLWTLTRVEGIEPTNNEAERALRHAVIWRRIGEGTDSERGSRFVERMPSVSATCRQQGGNVLDYLTSCLRANFKGQDIPALLPADPTQILAA